MKDYTRENEFSCISYENSSSRKKKKKTLKNRVKDTYIGILKEKEKKHGQTR